MESNKEHWFNHDDEDYAFIEEQADESESGSGDEMSDSISNANFHSN